MILDSSQFETNKIAGWLMPAIGAGLTTAGLASVAKENAAKSRLTPLDQDASYQLQSPYAYQFDGGKHFPTKPVIGLNPVSNF